MRRYFLLPWLPSPAKERAEEDPVGTYDHLLTDDYQSVDLTRLGYARIEAGQPYAELGVR